MKKETKTALTQIEHLYLDYYQDFITVDAFAEHHGLTTIEANFIIGLGREINHNRELLRNSKFNGEKDNG